MTHFCGPSFFCTLHFKLYSRERIDSVQKSITDSEMYKFAILSRLYGHKIKTLHKKKQVYPVKHGHDTIYLTKSEVSVETLLA